MSRGEIGASGEDKENSDDSYQFSAWTHDKFDSNERFVTAVYLIGYE